MRDPAAAPPADATLLLGDVEVDMDRQLVRRGDAEEALSTREAALLRYLVDRSGQPVEREDLLREVWGWRARTSTRALDNAVLRLRQKIEADPKRPRHVITVFGVGYRFAP